MRTWYSLIMDPELNPLSTLSPLRRLQLMSYLSLIWTAIFCAAAGAWAWYGQLIVAHVVLAMGLLATGWTFNSARAEACQKTTYRDYPLSDGTARYDDVWGG
jgi:Flp pilus assembly protein TadB